MPFPENFDVFGEPMERMPEPDPRAFFGGELLGKAWLVHQVGARDKNLGHYARQLVGECGRADAGFWRDILPLLSLSEGGGSSEV